MMSLAIDSVTRLVRICDRAYVYDNSVEGTEARLVLRCVGGKMRKTYGELPAWVAASVVGIAKDAEFEAS
jgi:hypothetical protein